MADRKIIEKPAGKDDKFIVGIGPIKVGEDARYIHSSDEKDGYFKTSIGPEQIIPVGNTTFVQSDDGKVSMKDEPIKIKESGKNKEEH